MFETSDKKSRKGARSKAGTKKSKTKKGTPKKARTKKTANKEVTKSKSQICQGVKPGNTGTILLVAAKKHASANYTSCAALRKEILLVHKHQPFWHGDNGKLMDLRPLENIESAMTMAEGAFVKYVAHPAHQATQNGFAFLRPAAGHPMTEETFRYMDFRTVNAGALLYFDTRNVEVMVR